tara:strand:+ start:14275 stop:16065 length:1791 start_codon:yes stop_codon:yes gene_type:complete
MSKDKKIIKYTNRDFTSIKEGLVDYAKRYYPSIHKDFSEASFGSLMLDTVSYVGDILSFYLDYQANESFLDTAVEYNNILRMGEQVGYKQPLKANSFGIATFYILVTTQPNATAPDLNYLPVLAKGTKITSNSGQVFSLVDDVNFADTNNEIITATSDNSGNPTSFAVKSFGKVVSGELKTTSISVGDFRRFLTVSIDDANVSEIISVIDTEGHQYFEVDYLSQDTVFRSVINKDNKSKDLTPNVMVATSIPRRFTVFSRAGQTLLKFGYGSESSLKNDNTTHPSKIVLQMHGRDYEKDTSFDPAKLIETDKFGISPANTILNVVYRANTTENSNLAARELSSISDPLFVFPSSATDTAKINYVKNSLECTNETSINGDVSLPTVSELKQRINDVFSSQNRAVTAEDYQALIYRMPSKFGKIKRAKIIRDQDSFKRNLNLYVLGEDLDGKLAVANPVLKNNVKTWINHYKMINDTVDILDPMIINIGINFTAVVNFDQDKYEALNAGIESIEGMFEEKLDIGQPIYIIDIFNKLNNLEEIVDVVNVEIVEKVGERYSDESVNLKHYTSADGRILYAPENAIYELKFANTDIKGTIK